MTDAPPSPPLAAPDAAATACQALADALLAAGHAEPATQVLEAAALLDLAQPALQLSWGGPMNGQAGRRALVEAILRALRPGAIIETGTYRATTTEWLAAVFAGPIHTCEAVPRLFLASRRKLARFAHVRPELADSRAFLRRLVPLLPRWRPALFYLDAHWARDLPLLEEIGIILDGCPRAAIMIDDFQVPFDDGYTWDNYGPGLRLTLELLEPLRGGPARLFLPTLPSAEETGARRGTLVMAAPAVAETLAALPGLRAVTEADWPEARRAGEADTNFLPGDYAAAAPDQNT